jgi:catechol 2,3-dioxygenase-like lactoylglutathione lyase family enzyme
VIDHVTIRVPELEASRHFYARALALLDFPAPPTEGEGFVEWHDFSIAQASDERPATRGLHVAFQATSRAKVDEWWRAMTEAGYPDDGAPGPRPEYSPRYYGAFIVDPAGNSVEAVHKGPRRHGGVLDHLWVRVRNLDDSTRFYDAVAPTVGYQAKRLRGESTKLPERTWIHGDGANFSLIQGDPTENVHLAFAAPDQATVRAFHEAGINAGYPSLGEPGERPQYHPGYYGAYLADPDHHNIEAVFHDRTQ